MAELRNGEGRGTTIRAKSYDCKRGAGRRNPLVASRQVLGAFSSPTPSRAFIVLRRRLVAIIPLCLVATVPLTAQRRAAAPVAATGIDTTSYAQLKFRHIGPEGNRVSSVAGVAGDVSVYYAGAASGGLWKTVDGGIRWQPIFDDQPVSSIGALAVAPSDLIMDPNNPRILFAGFWQVEVHTWGRSSGGAGSGIWSTQDGGTTWKRITGSGLPTRPIGKVGLAMTRANSSRIYALIETGDGVPAVNIARPDSGRLFRSDDGGGSWKLVNQDRQVAGRTHYYNRMAASPDNENEAYFLTAAWAKTLDGGETIIDPPDQQVPGGDHHDIWIDPS